MNSYKQFLRHIVGYLHSWRRKVFHVPMRLEGKERGLTDVDAISNKITELLQSDNPCMIARYGSVELDCIVNTLGVLGKWSKIEYLRYWFETGNCGRDWLEKYLYSMKTNAGFFPNTKENVKRFVQMMLIDSSYVDMLGSWLSNERFMKDHLPKNVIRCDREKLTPFFASCPWTLVLAGKKVLVVHPFADTIKKQFENKDRLFDRPMLPEFELQVLKSVQSLNGHCEDFETWFDALQWMEDQMDEIDYDVALIGCGAYGFPLAAHAKRTGHKAIHIGGALQLFFGIKGKRWESEGYIGTDHDYSVFFNEYWCRPSENETPISSNLVEQGCYW